MREMHKCVCVCFLSVWWKVFPRSNVKTTVSQSHENETLKGSVLFRRSQDKRATTVCVIYWLAQQWTCSEKMPDFCLVSVVVDSGAHAIIHAQAPVSKLFSRTTSVHLSVSWFTVLITITVIFSYSCDGGPAGAKMELWLAVATDALQKHTNMWSCRTFTAQMVQKRRFWCQNYLLSTIYYNYLIPCWFCTFAHWQRNDQAIILMVGLFEQWETE